MIVLLLSICILLFSGCDATITPDEKTFSVLSYNVQNLFDAKLEGSEYEEYQDQIAGMKVHIVFGSKHSQMYSWTAP